MQRPRALAVVLGFGLVSASISPAFADPGSPDGGVAGAADGSDGSDGAQPKLIPSSGRSSSRGTSWADTGDIKSHKGQLGISARLAVIGLSAIKPYNSNDYCGATTDSGTSDSAVCLNRLPVSLSLEPSYGISRHTELVVEFRIGLESDFGATPGANNGPHMVALAPGARFFFSEGRRSKLFTTLQAVFDFTNYENAAGASRGTDFGARNLNGLWIDLDRAYGFYFYVGETASVARWLRLDLEAGVGLQARFF